MPTDDAPDLSWLADSPFFLHGPQIRTFYDAVVGPAFRTVEMQISADRSGQVEKSVSGRVSAGLPKLFPGCGWTPRLMLGGRRRVPVGPAPTSYCSRSKVRHVNW
jgi:hypothetical protein